MKLKYVFTGDKDYSPQIIYQTKGSAAVDLTAVELVITEQYYIYHTKIHVEIPEGYYGLLVPRSSISARGMMLANTVGIIDSDYRGEIVIKMIPTQENTNHYFPGERVAQLLVLPVTQFEFVKTDSLLDLSQTDRGSNGFGSTGK